MSCKRNWNILFFNRYNYELIQTTQNSTFQEKEILYIFAPDGLFAINETKNGVNRMYYLSSDHLGSINLIVDGSNGNVVDDLSYDSWGRNRNPIDWSPSNFTLSSVTDRGYTSHEQLTNFGLINMNGRIYDPMTLGFLSPDPFVQNPSNSQNFNRFSYVLNNPLKYSDPSGYNYIDWTYAYGTGNGGPRHWKQELDYIYNRGEYSLGGGFSGLCKFYYVNGKGYQITSSGSIISTNKNDQGTNAFYRGDDFGFYAQTSGSVIYATKNGRTEGVATSDARCVWVSAGDPLPAWNDRGWRFYGMGYDAPGQRSENLTSKIWNSSFVRAYTGDAIFINTTFNLVFLGGGSNASGLILPLRGPDAFKLHFINTASFRIGGQGGWDVSKGKVWFNGPIESAYIREINGYGKSLDANFGIALGFGPGFGIFESHNVNGKTTWYGTYGSFGFGMGGSVGFDYTYTTPVFK